MDDAKITSAGKKPLLDVIEKFGSWSITNNNWDEYSWKLETILAKTTAYLNGRTFLSLSTMSSYFDNTKSYITVSEIKVLLFWNDVNCCWQPTKKCASALELLQFLLYLQLYVHLHFLLL